MTVIEVMIFLWSTSDPFSLIYHVFLLSVSFDASSLIKIESGSESLPCTISSPLLMGD